MGYMQIDRKNRLDKDYTLSLPDAVDVVKEAFITAGEVHITLRSIDCLVDWCDELGWLSEMRLHCRTHIAVVKSLFCFVGPQCRACSVMHLAKPQINSIRMCIEKRRCKLYGLIR